MSLSAGSGKVRDLKKEYVEHGALVCPDPQSGEEAWAVVCRALTDEVTPGFIDAGEAQYALGGRPDAAALMEASPFLAEPPLIARLEKLEGDADQWCLFNSCETRRQQAADAFLKLATAPGPLFLLPTQHLLRIRTIAMRMTGGPTATAKMAGSAAITAIDLALAQRSRDGALGPYTPAFEGAAFYLAPQFDFAPPRGLGLSLEYWQRMWSAFPDVNVGACEMSKRGMAWVDARSLTPAPKSARGRRSAIWKALSAATRKKQCTGPKDAYIVRPGKAGDLSAAMARFRPWQPYLESAFVAEGLPPTMATLAITESGMLSHKESGDGAVGPYQIMPGNVNIPDFDIQADATVGIDERENPYLAARAAALMLASIKRRIQQRRPKGDGNDGYVNGVTFDDSLAMLMATSGYHAGGGTLGSALRQARDEFKRQGKKLSGEALFVHILTSEKGYGTFQRDSKDYPVKLMPVIDALYGRGGPAGEVPPPEPMRDLALVEIGGFMRATGLADILRITGMGREEFLELNPQFRWEATADEICLNPETVNRVRIVLPTVLALRLRVGLAAEGRVEPAAFRAERIITPSSFTPATMASLETNRYVGSIGSPPKFVSLK